MNGLTNEERRTVLRAVETIYANKLVQVKGYRTLAERASDEQIRNLLTRIVEDEESHAEFWSERIEQLGGEHERKTGTYIRDLKVKLMMSVLGTKGFFEWAVAGED